MNPDSLSDSSGRDEQATGRYTQATQSIKYIQAHEPPDLQPSGRTQFMTHGYRVDRAVVLFHGYTNAPQQFRALGQRLFMRGYNVYLPRAPHHGLPDPLTTAHAQLTAGELKRAAEHAVEIAQGLGQQISVMGISMGGLMAAWVAQYHAEIRRAVLIAPALGFRAIPPALTPLARKATQWLPNIFRRWEPVHNSAGDGPRHAYQRYATRSLGQLLRLSHDLQSAAARSVPAARSVIVVTNANDETVDNSFARKLVAAWRQAGADHIRTHEFSAADHLIHDLIDPDQPRQRVDYVYKVLIDLLEQ
ncbi:MAG: alpha/beta fold hydrolase [Chloroflexi bacterium]|nr:alpha/beta fold hydrolase [Chloroflexota bacterium]